MVVFDHIDSEFSEYKYHLDKEIQYETKIGVKIANFRSPVVQFLDGIDVCIMNSTSHV